MHSDDKDGEIRFGAQVGEDAFMGVRRTEEAEEPILLRRLEDGAPVPPNSEVALINKECRDGWHTVKTLYRTGPAQVATPEYRDGWDRIFGGKQDVGAA